MKDESVLDFPTYHKINSLYMRDERGRIMPGRFSLPEYQYLESLNWTATEKIDGTNIRVLWNPPDTIIFRGRKDASEIPLFLRDELVRLFPVEKMAECFPETPLILYGEGYGRQIQTGDERYISDGVGFILFDVKIGRLFLERRNVVDIAGKLGIPVVPWVACLPLLELVELVAGGLASAFGPFHAEGVVAYPEPGLLTRQGNRIIVKIKHRDFCTFAGKELHHENPVACCDHSHLDCASGRGCSCMEKKEAGHHGTGEPPGLARSQADNDPRRVEAQ